MAKDKNIEIERKAKYLANTRIRKTKRKNKRRERRVMYWRLNCTRCCECCGCSCDFTFHGRW